jgi:outer membrane protein assembly factor BamB
MKKRFLLLLALISYLGIFAQDQMPVIWESKMDHKIMFNGTGTEDRNYSYAASDKEITFFANQTGRVKWTKPFKEIAPKLRSVDELIPFWESNAMFIFERKAGKDQIACIDMETGSLLWNSDKYQNVGKDNVVYIPERQGFAIALKERLVFIKVSNGEEIWSTNKFKGVVGKYVYTNDGFLVTVNFKPGALAALFSGFKNQIAKINMDNGDIAWENTYIGRAEKKVVSGDFIFNLMVEGNRVVLLLNGVQVYDYGSGINIWSAAFDFTPEGLGVTSANENRYGVYGAVAQPVFANNTSDLYVLDMENRRNQYVKKFDAKTGKLIWTSPEIKDARAIPGMYLIEDKLILQIGGIVEKQEIDKIQTEYYTFYVYKIYYDNMKPNGLQALNIKDGSLAWDSEKFKKGITNAITFGDNLIICSGKEFYSINYQDGSEKYSVPVTEGGVGNAVLVLPYKDKVIVVGEKGISAYNPVDGKIIYTSKYRASGLEDTYDNILVMKTDKSDIATFDLNSGKFKTFDARKGATTTLTTDGKFVYVYEDKVITKLSTE